jgi:hypothetical protein
MEYRRGTLADWLKCELEAIPSWSWNPREDEQLKKVELLKEYVKKHGWHGLSGTTRVEGVRLKAWANGRKRAYAAGKLSDRMRKQLEQIPGWTWSLSGDALKKKKAMRVLRRYIARHGWEKLRTSTVSEGIQIGRYVTRWRTVYRRDQLNNRDKEALESIPGWSWQSMYPCVRHRRMLNLLREFVAKKGWHRLTSKTRHNGEELGSWWSGRRQAYRKGTLAEWIIADLESIPGGQEALQGKLRPPNSGCEFGAKNL